MAIDWSKARQKMTSNPAYRGTRSPTLGANEGRGGMGNFRRTGRSFGPAGGPVPTRQQVAKNRRIATPRGVGDFAKGIYNTGKDIAGKFMHPSMMLMNSIANNQAQHDYLDDVYGEGKNTAFWNQAMGNLYAEPTPGSERPGSMQLGKTDTGTSLGQAGKYLTMAGVTDNVMQKFMDPNYKFAGNEAWLRAQAGGDGRSQEHFDTAMSFIKNAKATANLARGTQAMEAEADAFNRPSDRQPGLEPDMDITSDIVPIRKDKPRYVNPGQTPGPAGMGLMPNMDMDYGPLTAAGSGMISGYNRAEPGPFEYLPFYSGPFDFNFTPEDYEYGLYPPDQAYPGGGARTYAGGANALDRKLNAGNVGGSPTMGGNLASIDALGNRGYDVNNQGTIMPNISVEFGPFDDDEESNKINPAWNKGRLGLYN
tara:strand:- start:380 stop:1648 length:1269 start_codon:yes stop_codon:yes gene_type:complete